VRWRSTSTAEAIATKRNVRGVRIAQLAPPWFPVPPSGYGGIELVVSLLADGLAERGHEVTLFASGGSRTRAELFTPMVDPPDPALLGNVWFDAFHAVSSYLHHGEFDVIHDHSGLVGPALGALLESGPPVVHTCTARGRAVAPLLRPAHERINWWPSAPPRADKPGICASRGRSTKDRPVAVTVQTEGPLPREHRPRQPRQGPVLAVESPAGGDAPGDDRDAQRGPRAGLMGRVVGGPPAQRRGRGVRERRHANKVDLLAGPRRWCSRSSGPEPFRLVMVEAWPAGRT